MGLALRMSKIEWTDITWNPVTGCDKVSEGCRNCYAERMAKRLAAMPNPGAWRHGFQVATHWDILGKPYKWKKPRRIFVCSMADPFHIDVPTYFIRQVFDVMEKNPQHTFQVLTKRASRLRALSGSLPWPDNIWAGVSIEDDSQIDRVECLEMVPAKVRFLSCEPLLGPLGKLIWHRTYSRPIIEKMQWVIVGGESGPNWRPMQLDWVRAIRDKCVNCNIPFFFKQHAGMRPKALGRLLDGREWNEYPDERRKQ